MSADGRGDRADDGDLGELGEDPRVQAGLEHLQRAAQEVIAASRALLDVAEELVEDPRAAGSLVGLLGAFAGWARPGTARDQDDPGDDPPVERIPVA